MDYYQKNVVNYLGQRYQIIQETCLLEKVLFEDEYFLPLDESVFLKTAVDSVSWQRAREICTEPHLMITNPSALDVYTGKFGSSSFAAACSIIANQQDFWNRVIPDSSTQEMYLTNQDDQYCGIFRFRFWRFGSWCEVVIDDKLPVVNGQLYCVRSSEPDVFWCSLLEKAYAKVLGCYEAIQQLDAGYIVQDMSGCVLQDLPVARAVDVDVRNKYFKELMDAPFYGRTMLTCVIKPQDPAYSSPVYDHSLVVGRYYCISAVKLIKPGTGFSGLVRHFKSERIQLVKVRDPSGAKDWSGPWSDGSEEWKEVGESEKRQMGLAATANGEFWMSFSDFCSIFTDVSICRILQTSGIRGQLWKESYSYGRWIYDGNPDINTAGGSLELCPETFLQNPQYRFDIANEGMANVVMQLSQKESRVHSTITPSTPCSIGMYVLKIEQNRLFKMHKVFPDALAMATPLSENRTVIIQTWLPKGRYALIPTTHKPSLNWEFLLRIYSETNISFNALVFDYPDRSCWACCVGYPKIVSRVRVVRGTNCLKLDSRSVGNVYVVIACEGRYVRSKTFKNTENPLFDSRAVFYRKNPLKPILFNVYMGGLICDTFIGQGNMEGSVDNNASSVEIPLHGKGSQSEKRYPGTLYVDIASSEDIKSL